MLNIFSSTIYFIRWNSECDKMPHNSELYRTVKFRKLLENLTPSFQDYFHAEEAHILEHILPESRVLEIGCGSGRVMTRMAHTAVEGLAAGVDYSTLQLEDAVKNMNGSNNVEFYLQDGRNLGFKDDSFDIACLTWNLLGSYNRKNQIALLGEAKRVVKPGGLVIASVFAENALPFQVEQYDNWGFLYKGRGPDFVEICGPGLDIYSRRFRRHRLEKLCQDSGFEEYHIHKIAKFAYVIEAIK